MEEYYEHKIRVNPLCVIAKNERPNGGRDLQANSSWQANPFGDAYAIVPDEMVPAMVATCGYLEDLVLTEDGTEVVSFVPGAIPEVEPDEPEVPVSPASNDVWGELDEAYMEGVNGAYDE